MSSFCRFHQRPRQTHALLLHVNNSVRVLLLLARNTRTVMSLLPDASMCVSPMVKCVIQVHRACRPLQRLMHHPSRFEIQHCNSCKEILESVIDPQFFSHCKHSCDMRLPVEMLAYGILFLERKSNRPPIRPPYVETARARAQWTLAVSWPHYQYTLTKTSKRVSAYD